MSYFAKNDRLRPPRIYPLLVTLKWVCPVCLYQQNHNIMRQIIHIGKLSERELEVLTMISRGMSSRQIAETLNLSLETVNTHRKNILRKTDAPNMMTVIAMAMQRRLLRRDMAA